MAFVALASLSVNVSLFRKGGTFPETPFGTEGPQSEILCLLGPNPQQSDDLTIQIAAQLLYQILNLDKVY